LKFIEFLQEITSSGDIATYEVPHIKGKGMVKTQCPMQKRHLKNLPRYATGRARVKFQDWLGLDSNGLAKNGKYYGYSHRAIYGFCPGQEVKKGDISMRKGRNLPYKIKDNADALWHAKKFTSEVS